MRTKQLLVVLVSTLLACSGQKAESLGLSAVEQSAHASARGSGAAPSVPAASLASSSTLPATSSASGGSPAAASVSAKVTATAPVGANAGGSAELSAQSFGSAEGLSSAQSSVKFPQASPSGSAPLVQSTTSASSSSIQAQACTPDEVRCLTQRERCSSEGSWVKEDYVCTTDLTGTIEQGLFCAVKADGTLSCWGDSFFLKEVQPIPSGSWRRVFLTDDFAQTNICAIDTNGEAVCWGPGGTRRLGNQTLEIAVGQFGIFAIHANGELLAHDNLSVKQALGAEPGGAVSQIVTNDGWLFALDPSGVIQSPFPFTEGTYRLITSGEGGLCALSTEGQVVCSSPEQTQLAPAGEHFSAFAQRDSGGGCGITLNGNLLCWGASKNESSTPPEGKFKQLAASAAGMCALGVDGVVKCWGPKSTPPPDGW